LVAQWSDEEVARRWLLLKRSQLELREPPTADAIAALVADTKKLAAVRRRLSSISWFCAYLKEPISRLCNHEDDAAGHFWAERFGCTRLGDDASLLVCSLYVNLNPARAGLAQSIETSEHTSVHARLVDRRSGDAGRPASGFFAAVHVDGDGYAGAADGRRPSDKGYLGVTFDEYLELLDEQLRRVLAERAGVVLNSAPPVLERLGISREAWEASIRLTSRRFARDLEVSAKMKAEARRMTAG
jgi:hypothetical protein